MAYKWDHPHDWLHDRIRRLWDKGDIQQLVVDFEAVIRKVDGDELQDIFQSDMDADGYFDEGCGHKRVVAYTEDGVRYHACRDCDEIWEQTATEETP